MPIVVTDPNYLLAKDMASDPKYFRRAIVDIMMKNYCPDTVSIQQPCFLGLQTCLNFYITKMLFAPNFKKLGLATSARFRKWEKFHINDFPSGVPENVLDHTI